MSFRHRTRRSFRRHFRAGGRDVRRCRAVHTLPASRSRQPGNPTRHRRSRRRRRW